MSEFKGSMIKKHEMKIIFQFSKFLTRNKQAMPINISIPLRHATRNKKFPVKKSRWISISSTHKQRNLDSEEATLLVSETRSHSKLVGACINPNSLGWSDQEHVFVGSARQPRSPLVNSFILDVTLSFSSRNFQRASSDLFTFDYRALNDRQHLSAATIQSAANKSR